MGELRGDLGRPHNERQGDLRVTQESPAKMVQLGLPLSPAPDTGSVGRY
jgi:hypothetical protein